MRSSLLSPRRLAPFFLAVFLVLGMAGRPSQVRADTFRQGSTVLVSTWPNGSPADGAEPSVSSDGRYVAFSSVSPLTPDDTDQDSDVFRKDMTTGGTILVSPSVAGVPFSAQHYMPSISADGNRVAYLSGICFPDITTFTGCVGRYAHIRDLAAGVTRLISDPVAWARSVRISGNGQWAAISREVDDGYWVVAVNSDTGQSTNVAFTCDLCTWDLDISISDSGRRVAFESYSAHVQSDQDGGHLDVYVYDRDSDADGIFDESGATSFQLAGILPNGSSPGVTAPEISGDGTKVAFIGWAGTLSESIVDSYVYVRDLQTNTTVLSSQSSLGVRSSGYLQSDPHRLAISGSGNVVAFHSTDSYLDPPDTNPLADVYVRDHAQRRTVMGSILPDGAQDFGEKRLPALSSDGNFLAFSSTRLKDESRLDRRVYLRDLRTACGVICLEQPSRDPGFLHKPVETITLNSRSSGVTSQTVLKSWVRYRIEAYGAFRTSSGNAAWADAECFTPNAVTGSWVKEAPGTDIDLGVNGQPQDWRPIGDQSIYLGGGCSDSHTYYLSFVGQGAKVQFVVLDSYRGDNQGDLRIEIFEESEI